MIHGVTNISGWNKIGNGRGCGWYMLSFLKLEKDFKMYINLVTSNSFLFRILRRITYSTNILWLPIMCSAVFTYHVKGSTSFLCSECFPFPQTFPLGLGEGQFYAWTDGLRRKDWHDYESIQKEAMRSGMKFSVSQSAPLLTAVSHLSLKESWIHISSAYSKVCLMGLLEVNTGQN